MYLRFGQGEWRMPALPAEEFPPIPEISGTAELRLPMGEIRDAVDSVSYAVADDNSRPVLTGILFTYDGKLLTLVATDTHRLAVRELLKEGMGSTVTAIVPAKALRAIQALPFGDDMSIELNFGNGRVGVATDAAKIVTQLLMDKYPNWERVVPAESTRSWSLERDQLGSKVRRAMIVAKDSANRLRFKGNEETLLIAARSEEKGDAKEELTMISTNGELEIAFNGKYVLDALEPISGPGIKVEMTESMRPAIFRSAEEDKNYFCVIMPMSLM